MVETAARPAVPAVKETGRRRRMRAAINLLTDDPSNPSGAHWFWTRVIKEMANRLDSEEELHLLVSPKSRPLHQGYGPKVHYITYPWSNERRGLRTLSEHLYSPVRMPLGRIDVLNTLMAPVTGVTSSLVIHIKTMHAFTAPESMTPLGHVYRRLSYPRSVHLADAVIINSHSLRAEIDRYLEVDPRKLKLIYEAVDHDVFKPGRRGRGPGPGGRIWHHEAVRSLCVVAVDVQELRRVAPRLGPGPGPARGPAAGDRRARRGRQLHRPSAPPGG